MPDQTLLLELGQNRQRLLNRTIGRFRDASYAQVDDFEQVKTQIAEIVVDRRGQFVPGESMEPRSIFSSPRANLGHNDQIVGIWKKRFSDDLVGDVRAIEIGGIDMVHA